MNFIPVVFPFNMFYHNHVVLNNLAVANGQQIQDAIPNETPTHIHLVHFHYHHFDENANVNTDLGVIDGE